MPDIRKAIVFYNLKSGHSKFEKHQELIRSHFQRHDIKIEIIEVPKPQEEINRIVSQAVDEGVSFFVAAGGDGTASLVGNSLIGTGKPMGIIPLGTGNMLAKELKLPLRIEKSLEIITTENPNILKMDTMNLDGKHYLINISVGVSPQIMQVTETEEKKRFGFIAYLAHFTQQLLGLKLHRFDIDVDNKKRSYTASEVLITNSRRAIFEPLEWADDVAIDDGIMDMFIIRAANIRDFIEMLFSIFTKKQRMSPIIKIIQFKNYCRIKTQSSLPIQADGDLVGVTPLEIQVKPLSLSVIVGQTNIY